MKWVFLLAAILQAQSIELTWDRHPDLDVTGYVAYWGTTAQYGDSMDVGRVERALIDSLLPGRTYYFAVRAYDRSRNLGALSSPLSFNTPSVIRERPLPSAESLPFLVYPNPFSGVLFVSFEKETFEKGPQVSVFDLKGRLLSQGQIAAGARCFTWNAKAAPGIYLIRVNIGNRQYVQKVTLFR